jgi:hypothetical protein
MTANNNSSGSVRVGMFGLAVRLKMSVELCHESETTWANSMESPTAMSTTRPLQCSVEWLSRPDISVVGSTSMALIPEILLDPIINDTLGIAEIMGRRSGTQSSRAFEISLSSSLILIITIAPE